MTEREERLVRAAKDAQATLRAYKLKDILGEPIPIGVLSAEEAGDGLTGALFEYSDEVAG